MNRKVTLSRVGALALVTACGSTLLLDQTACSKDSLPPAGQEPILIGMSAALNGGYSGSGRAMEKGAQTAIDLINSKGGVLGRPVALDIEDDLSSNADDNNFSTLKTVINGFRARNVAAIIGPGASVQTEEAQKITFPADANKNLLAGQKPTLLISAWSTGVGISDLQNPWPNRFLYRTAPSDIGQRIAMWMHTSEQVGDAGSTVARCNAPFLVYAPDALGKGFFDYIKGKVGQQNTLEVNTGEQSDYVAAVKKIHDTRPLPDCVMFVTYEKVSAALVRELKVQYKSTEKLSFIGTDATYDDNFIADVGNPQLVEGMIGVAPDTRPRTTSFDAFRLLYQAQQGGGAANAEPPAFASSAFDAVALVALAIQKAGTADDPTAIRDALVEVSRGYGGNETAKPANVTLVRPDTIGTGLSVLAAKGRVDYDGASGTVDFDEKGDIRSGYVKWQVQAGKFVDTGRYQQGDLVE